MILPNINKTVTLNDVEIHAGSELAFRRFNACETHNILNRKVASRKTNQEISELGVLSEIAFAK